MNVTAIFGIALLLSGFSAFADVQPASPFTDHMVLQRNAPAPVWGTASPGEKVTVSFDKQQRKVVAGPDGKWMIRLDPMKAGGPFVLKITGRNTISFQDVYVGEVWLCSGQSNMDMTVAREDRYWCGVYNEQQELAAADYPMIRVFDVDFVTSDKPVDRAIGTWEICSPATVGHFSAAAYFFARELYKRYQLPIGLITTAYGASTAEAWTSRKTLESDPLFAELLRNYEQRKAAYDTSLTAISRYKIAYAKWQTDSAAAREAKKDPPRGPRNADPRRDQHSPFVLYNGMVAPLIPYAIRGAIWYQGESNSPTADIYDRIMAALIGNWRADWGQGNFPFIYVQLANNGKNLDTIPGKGGGTTRVREGQGKNLSVPNTAMVVAIDNADDPANVHPKNKQEIGRRLALDAEALAYGEKINYSGPLYDRMKVEGNAIRLSFTQVDGGLVAGGNDSAARPIPGLPAHRGSLNGFAIAGADKKFVWGDARIDGNTILVSSPAVPIPVAVRYGWGDNPLISLYNQAGLPAAPFRTDDWSLSPAFSFVQDTGSHFTSAEVLAVLHSGSGVSGAGFPVTGNGWGGWRSGMGGALYAGDHPNPLWKPLPATTFSGSVINKGLLPPITPCWDAHIRDAVICVGGDGNYYMTGSTGDNIWAFNDGVELWRSADLHNWQYMGLVWSIEKEGGWEKEWRNLHDHPARALWAPELHYIKGNYFICLSMPPYGISILKSTTGKPEGPYVHATDPNRSFVRGIDPTLFEDEDGKVYFTYSGANRIVRMKDDLSDTAEAWHRIELADPDHDSTHHAARCAKRGMNDLGTEGAVLFKANGKYYLGAADEYQGRYSTCLAMSDNIYGPYRMRHESVPSGGGTGFFRDRQGNWYSTFFGNDDQSPWREKPGIVKVGFDPAGKTVVAALQPFACTAAADAHSIPVSTAAGQPAARSAARGPTPPAFVTRGPAVPGQPIPGDTALSWKFDLGGGTAREGYVRVPRGTLYTPENGYGFDLGSTGIGRPFYFSVKLPEGDYNVSVTLGDPTRSSITTIRAECRRLMVEKSVTAPGQFVTRNFTVHVRDSINHRTGMPVHIKGREYAFLHWDDKLTLEFSNAAPRVSAISITPAGHPLTVFLAGNSTVVDQAYEPWAAWGQMIPSFFAPGKTVVANYAESGETLKAFVNEGRLDKIWSVAQPGDYLFIEFAHNDQKEGPNHLDPFTTYKEKLAWYIGEARQRGMIPVLVTSMHRRNFDPSGHIVNTLGDFPEAMRQTARELNTPLIDLNVLSRNLFEAWGPERSVHAFVHYPAHTFPDQDKELKDDTHFNSYGAYELARCVVKGIREHVPELAKYLADGLPDFDPAHPDPIDSFSLPMSPRIYLRRPERDVVLPQPTASATVSPQGSTILPQGSTILPPGNSVYNIRDFGAVGDGKTLDTRAINQAIDRAAANGGGTVWFPAGIWLSYSIHLRSNISLYLDPGAVILAADPSLSDSTLGYDAPEPTAFNSYQDFGHSHWHNSLIWGEELTNISILGTGIIFGRGLTRETPPSGKGPGNKAIALKLCRNVILRDFTILFGGHFAILATGVDNFTVDDLKMDTNRDGIDVDCCRQVHISNCSINSPWDDGLCLKSSFGLGFARATENVTITGCLVSGFDRGTFYDGTYQQKEAGLVPDGDGPTGRIKFGTESNGGFRNISISNCVFDHCRGLALETVDGGLLEDVTISNITMRNICNSPIFLRLGSRMRGPAGTPVGVLRRVSISDVTVYDADSRFASIISGVPGHAIEDIRLNNIRIWYKALDSSEPETGQNLPAKATMQAPPEKENKYPEPSMFGNLPAYGFFIRHAKNIQLNDVQLSCAGNETRPAFVLQDAEGVEFQQIKARNPKPVILTK